MVERLIGSKFDYYFSFCLNSMLIAWIMMPPVSHMIRGERTIELTLLILLGYLVWTLAEWLVHKFVYHNWTSAFTIGHDIHHKDPKKLIGVPWLLNTPAYFGLYYWLYFYVFQSPVVGALMGGFAGGYVIYCAIHHSLHHWRLNNRIFKRQLAHHNIHHMHPESNIGISISLWDWVFGTKRVAPVHVGEQSRL